MKLQSLFLSGLGIAAGISGIHCNTQNQQSESEKDSSKKQAYNVLFIAVDDLRPELNCYGAEHIHSPNIDKLAASGIRFNRAYCNIPVSGASRASLLTGTRPTRHRFLTYYSRIDEEMDTVPTIGEYFKNNGYHTIHNSKVMHHPGDAPRSWSEEWWPECEGSWRNYVLPENLKMDTVPPKRGPAYEMTDVHDTAYKDGKTAEKTIADLKKLKDSSEPFFLATGFFKPHLPFNAPKKYWDIYKRDEIQLPENDDKPENAPQESMHNWGELRAYLDIPETGSLSDSMARTLIHGYYACVSYTDAQVGKVLDALDELGLAENTIVVLWGDHGWNLREHGLWCKHCNFENALNAPLIIRAPGIEGGKSTNVITEFVDIYPTICDLAGLDLPAHLEGESVVDVLKNPEKDKKDWAVCKWKEGVTYIEDSYFYTEWSDSTKTPYARMLYNHANDPQENVNVSEKQENQELIQDLKAEMHQKWGEDFYK